MIFFLYRTFNQTCCGLCLTEEAKYADLRIEINDHKQLNNIEMTFPEKKYYTMRQFALGIYTGMSKESYD